MTNELFKVGSDWKSNAIIWSYASNNLYKDGYNEAAVILAEKVIESGQDQDILVYPISFLYRQYVELQLKGNINDLRNLLREDEKGYPKIHNIKKLWILARALLKEMTSKIDPSISTYITDERCNEMEGIIFNFDQIDEISFTFRYPEDKKGNENLKDFSYINIKNIAQQMNQLSEGFKRFDLVIGRLQESKDDAESTYEL